MSELSPRGEACCVRCAQMYKAWPDLRCDPNHREDATRKGLTRKEPTGCKNCRTFKVKCDSVSELYHSELAILQSAARLVVEARGRGRVPPSIFYKLRRAQEEFSKVCFVGMQ